MGRSKSVPPGRWCSAKMSAGDPLRDPIGPPQRTVDTTIFEMWLGRLSTHQGLSNPVV